MVSRTAVYPGTFDPITFGHADVIKRAAQIVDKLIVAVAVDTSKKPIFDLQQRIDLVLQDISKMDIKGCEISVIGFEGLLVNFAKEHEASIIIRGLRAVSDFEYEFQMSGMNSKLNPEVQTVFLPASESTHFIASSFVKEIARLGGKVDDLVSKNVRNKLEEHYLNV